MPQRRSTTIFAALLLALALGLAPGSASAQPGEGCCRCEQCPNGDFCVFHGDRTCTEVCAGCGAIDPIDLCTPDCFPVSAPAASGRGLVLATGLLAAVGATTLAARRRRGSR
jgi:hypothetical protein